MGYQAWCQVFQGYSEIILLGSLSPLFIYFWGGNRMRNLYDELFKTCIELSDIYIACLRKDYEYVEKKIYELKTELESLGLSRMLSINNLKRDVYVRMKRTYGVNDVLNRELYNFYQKLKAYREVTEDLLIEYQNILNRYS